MAQQEQFEFQASSLLSDPSAASAAFEEHGLLVLAGLVCRLVVVALFAPRRFWPPSSRKRLERRRYVTGPDPDFC